ncbi:MAG: hypothetical protein P9M14_15910 [Candidatus Alcyoniella australis]|nr:hypothetical protein [Candidatus Alcyoniella australis]
MRRSIALVLIVCLLLPVAALAADVQLYGFLLADGRLLAQKLGRAKQAAMHSALAWLDLSLNARGSGGKARMFADVDLRYDVLDQPIDAQQGEQTDVRLREAYGMYLSKYFAVAAGRRIYQWGDAYEYNPIDVVNPDDLSSFFTYDKSERKIGVWMLEGDLFLGPARLEVVWIPLFEPDRIPSDPDQSIWVPHQLRIINTLATDFDFYIEELPEKRPEPTLNNSEVAARLGLSLRGWDIYAVAFDGFDDFPTYRIDTYASKLLSGDFLQLQRVYQRVNVYGLSVSTGVGGVGLRFEGSFTTPKWYLYELPVDVDNADLNYETAWAFLNFVGKDYRTRKATVDGIVAADYMWESGRVVAQYFHLQILDYEPRLFDAEMESGTILNVEQAFLEDMLAFSVSGFYNFAHGDWLLHPGVDYLFTDDFALQLSAYIMGGEEDTRFGEFDKNDMLVLRAKYNF